LVSARARRANPDRAIALRHDAAILDVGGGASRLAARLLTHGFTDITVLDISSAALDPARAELGANASRVQWVEHDLLAWSPPRSLDLWYDRAVFHFLVDPRQRERYVEVLRSAITADGKVIIGTFAADGPTSCSGLPVARYDPDNLAAALGATFMTLATDAKRTMRPAARYSRSRGSCLNKRHRNYPAPSRSGN
jgi:SAM-dependent methyltransferase